MKPLYLRRKKNVVPRSRRRSRMKYSLVLDACRRWFRQTPCLEINQDMCARIKPVEDGEVVSRNDAAFEVCVAAAVNFGYDIKTSKKCVVKEVA